MSLPLNTNVLEGAYNYLRLTPPFIRWNLPDSEDIIFEIGRSANIRGYYRKANRMHVIGISSALVGRSDALVETMAHEMVHLHIGHAGLRDTSDHGRAFKKYSEQVCRVHGFDPKLF